MSIGLLATGDELITGDTLNTNMRAIAQYLSSEGILVGNHMTASDTEPDILHCMQYLLQTHHILIITGGLGPTEDDRTRYALAQCIGEELITYPEAISHIATRLQSVGLSFTPENRQQALFPKEAQLLANPMGTAMGCALQRQDTYYFLLPGPPRECLPMFEQHVLPLLQSIALRRDTITRKWLLFGVSEGHIAAELEDAVRDFDCTTGYRLDMPYLECKIHAKPQILDTIAARIDPMLAPYRLTRNNLKASSQLSKMISDCRIPLCIHDQLTGGRLQALIHTPENASWLCFDQAIALSDCLQDRRFFVKPDSHTSEEVLHCSMQGLHTFWEGNETCTHTEVTFICHYRGAVIAEHHGNMPFRPRKDIIILQYAAEWISAQLLLVLEKVHPMRTNAS